MKLILTAPNPELFVAFQESFFYLPNVEIANKRFEDLTKYDPPKYLNCFVAAERQLQIWEGGEK